MSKTNLPRFTGEASLYSASNHYYVHGMYHRTEQKIYPADYIDQTCLADCTKDCGSECAGTTGLGRSKCIHECAQDNAACDVTCTRPGSPPPPPPPPPRCTSPVPPVIPIGGPVPSSGCPPLLPGGSGLPIYGVYCGPGHTDPTGCTPPVDAVDAVCRAHDLCYDALGYSNCACDAALIAAMPAAIAGTPCSSGKITGAAAMAFFSGAPCWCLIPPGLGVGGQIPPLGYCVR
jgi:hypothetical protein